MTKIKNISREELSRLCWAFHKWFRVADCDNNTDINMWKAIDELSNEDYVRAMEDSLKEIGIEVKRK